MIERGEIDLRPFILQLADKGVRIALPVIIPDDAHVPGEPRLYCREFEDETALSKNPWGVSEPLQSKCVPPNEIEVVIVPALGVGLNGYRIGYGKGHYDEFLAGLAAPTVCPVYDACLISHVPAEPHDVPMSVIVTENEIVRPHRT